MKISTKTFEVGGKALTLETGRFSPRANAAVMATYGETVVIAHVVMGGVNENIDYFPLYVEYQEKLFAGGKIKGSRWVKRDGRPTDEAVLKARLIDRTIRPLFPKGFKNEIQVILTVLSVDGENDADIPAMYATAAALGISDIPFGGPVAAVRIGLTTEGEFIVNPTFSQRETSLMDLVISGTETATVMVEAGANEVSEEKIIEAFLMADQENRQIVEVLGEFVKEAGKEKAEFETKELAEDVVKLVTGAVKGKLTEMVKAQGKLEPVDTASIINELHEKNEDIGRGQIKEALDSLLKEEARRLILEDGVRPDGRATTEIRQLESEVGVLPRTHGSAFFQRGQTQALTVTTLGSPSLQQLIENMEGEESKRYIHHYAMPPYTVGEVGRVGWPSRREVGHGALAERALEPVIPTEDDFPYTIHVASQLMSSNGSTSMASVCGSTMSLMDAGVPLKKPVAGIAMGLMQSKDGKKNVILSDIQGLEDHTGDMDFKVAGTQDGITALQMDIKVSGISQEVLKEALEQAKVGRLHILEHMLSTIPEPRKQLSPFAPKIETIMVPVERIGEVIGPGGKVIRGIIERTGAEIDINDDGRVFITSADEVAIQEAKQTIEGIIKEVEPGEVYQGTVSRIENFGAFVDIAPGKTGLVHVSRLSTEYIQNPRDVVNLGDVVTVTVTEIDEMGRINLTMLTPEQEAEAKERRAERPQRGGGDHNRGGGGGFRPRRRDDRRR